ncbi:zinc finger protein [Salix suchowensis]|nr:zinc finger protein [Salix suchowensis]
MEKVCEFCKAARPVVYCKADAAYLCLSCDAKIHSANALFNRHLRTLLCDSCRNHPAYAQCLDHRMLMCLGCDRCLHEVSSHHQKQLVSSYLGCPSAKDFASLWGFEFGELDKSVVKDQLVSISCSSVQPSASKFDIPGKSCQQIGRSSRKSRLSYIGPQKESTLFILEQILDLKRLQLTDFDNNTPMKCDHKQKNISSMLNTSNKLDYNLNHSQHSQDLRIFALSFSQPEHLPFFSTAANALPGESFWPSKSPIENIQLWSQNMQDLGVCEDNICHDDDYNIPDVDKTFSNFEEFFGGDQDPIQAFLDENDFSCSFIEKDIPLEKSNNSDGRARKDASAASSVYISCSVHIENDKDPSSQTYNCSGSLDLAHTIRSPYSRYSISSHGAEGRSNEYLDSELSPYISNVEAPCHSPDLEGAHTEARENAMMRYKEKKKARMQDKQIRYAPRKPKSDVRKRGNG